MSLDGTDNEHDVAYADGNLVPVDHGRDGEAFLQHICSRYGINMETAMELQDEFEENMPHVNSDSRAVYFWLRAMMIIQGFKRNRLLALDSLLLALGSTNAAWFEVLGCKTQVELARRWKVTKAAVNKCVGLIAPPLKLPTKRSEESKIKFQTGRIAQLKPKKSKKPCQKL